MTMIIETVNAYPRISGLILGIILHPFVILFLHQC